jgi:hypothetical protein
MREIWHLDRKWIDMPGPIETILWMLAVVVKFIVTPSIMIGRGVGWLPTVMICSVGASFGVLLFFYFGKWLFKEWKKWRDKKGPAGPVFTPGRRRWVRFRKRFGLWGLLLISGLISVPIASVLASKYHAKDSRMPALLMLAFALWTIVLTSLSWLVSISAF